MVGSCFPCEFGGSFLVGRWLLLSFNSSVSRTLLPCCWVVPFFLLNAFQNVNSLLPAPWDMSFGVRSYLPRGDEIGDTIKSSGGDEKAPAVTKAKKNNKASLSRKQHTNESNTKPTISQKKCIRIIYKCSHNHIKKPPKKTSPCFFFPLSTCSQHDLHDCCI